MKLMFVPPAESGWRGPGAPRKQVPDHIVEMLEFARNSGQIGILDIRGDSPDDITEAVNALRTGARHLGRRINIQRDRQKHQIRFRIGEALTP
jgi:hypothetical protein